MARPTRGFEFVKNLAGGNEPPVILDLPVSANTLRIGDLVVLSSGQLAACAAGAALFTGVMAESAEGATAGDLRKVHILQRGQVWKCSGDGAAQAGNIGVATINIVDANTIDTTPATGGQITLLEKGEIDDAGNQVAYVTFGVGLTFG